MNQDHLPPLDWYEGLIKSSQEYDSPPLSPDASVIVVAYNTNWKLVRCLDSLKDQTLDNFEVLVVDNGKNDKVFEDLKKFPIRYFQLQKNFLPSSARNVGIAQAKSEVICFLDDDGIAHPEFVEAHIAAVRSKVLGVRGKIIPRTKNLYKYFALHYNLGDKIIPSQIELEGNCSFPKHILDEVNGFNPHVFGGEGAELSYRIFKKFGEHDRLLYWPTAVIFHDFAHGILDFLEKTVRGIKMEALRKNLYPDFEEFMQSYLPLPYEDIPWPENKISGISLLFLYRIWKLIHKWGPIVFSKT